MNIWKLIQQQIENENLLKENKRLKEEIYAVKKEKEIVGLNIKKEYTLLLDTSKKDITNIELSKNKISQQIAKYKTLVSALKKIIWQ